MLDWNSFTSGSTAAAVGAVGTASFAIVDGLKTLPVVGISNAGYCFIERAIQRFFRDQRRGHSTGSIEVLFDTLHGNWINGRGLEDQKAIAKSLIKLQLSVATSRQFAIATGVDAEQLSAVGAKMSNNEALDPTQVNVLGRFDLELSGILDDAYQHADQRYRNWSKLAATCVAVILALGGGLCVGPGKGASFWGSADMGACLLAGLLASPLAPMAKDVASALQAGVKVAQALRR